MAFSEELKSACEATGNLSETDCTCFADVATTSLSEEDQYYLAMIIPGPDGARAALEDLAGDAPAFMERYKAFSALLDTTCFAAEAETEDDLVETAADETEEPVGPQPITQ